VGLLLDWVVDRAEGSCDQFKLGALAAILPGLQNRGPTLAGARIEENGDGEIFMVAPSTPLRVDARDGSLDTSRAIDYLAKNKLLEITRTPSGELCIGLGARVKKLNAEGGEENGK
jgi:hypothetical protein